MISLLVLAMAVGQPLAATQEKAGQSPAIKEFNERIHHYMDLHKKVEKAVDPVDETANASILQKQKQRFAALMTKSRPNAAQGDIFTARVRPVLLDIIKRQLAGPEGAKARSMILGEGNPKSKGSYSPITVKVNTPYPAEAPQSTVPPSLLQALPALPEELEYRFIGRTLILKDAPAGLIVDFIPDAVTATPTREAKTDKVLLGKTGDSGSLQFAVIGDTGTGQSEQYAVAKQLESYWKKLGFNFTLMVGDNLYGSDRPKDFAAKFEKPYQALLAGGVKFYAALGNHDDAALQKAYKPFNMEGGRYYTFKPKDGVRFFALDSNYMDKEQLEWLEKELSASGSDWKILFFHHPLYSSGEKHGSNLELRSVLEPLIVKHGVDVVFTGHEHFYERLRPQNGVQYFIIGSSAKLRRGNIATTDLTAKGFDQDLAFFIAEIQGDEMRFQTVSRKGAIVDSGTVQRVEKKPASRR